MWRTSPAFRSRSTLTTARLAASRRRCSTASPATRSPCSASAEGIFGHRFIVGTVPRQATLEEREAGHFKVFRNECLIALEKTVYLARSAACPARKRDVRMKCAALGLQSDRYARALHFPGKAGKRFPRLNTSP